MRARCSGSGRKRVVSTPLGITRSFARGTARAEAWRSATASETATVTSESRSVNTIQPVAETNIGRASAAFGDAVKRRDDHRHGTHQTNGARQQIGVEHVAVQHTRPQLAQNPGQARHGQRVRHSRPHVERITPADSSLSKALGCSSETTCTSQPRRPSERASCATCISAPPRARLVVSSTTGRHHRAVLPPGARTAAHRRRPWHPRRSWRRDVRPAAPSSRPPSELAGQHGQCAAKAAPSPAGASRPVSPSSTSSGTPPTAVATTGSPAAMASITASGWPSQSEASAKRSQAESSSGTSGAHPEKCTRSPTPSLPPAPSRLLADCRRRRSAGASGDPRPAPSERLDQPERILLLIQTSHGNDQQVVLLKALRAPPCLPEPAAGSSGPSRCRWE